MRDEHEEFVERSAVILAVGPNNLPTFLEYWQKEQLPFTGLPDPDHRVAMLYRQEVNLFKLGRMPLLCVVDFDGNIRFVHYGDSMSDIPSNQKLLQAIDKIRAE